MDADQRSEALRHDVEALEQDADEAAEGLANYLLPRVLPVVLAAVVLAWLIRRNRSRRVRRA